MAATLMFWNKQNSNNQNGNDAKNTKNGRNWLHAPDVLVNGHVAYLVKFLGSTPVEQAKGIEVVKEAIRRLQFTQQMKKAEGGGNVKTKKVEITVSVDGVAIQEPRTQTILYQFPLHKISYCADEKGVKKFFSFIAKTSTGAASTPSLSANSDDTHSSHSADQDGQHECFVFISNKLASDITLTIGQAFDLAYRRYVNDSGKNIESTKLQTQNKQLESTVNVYRQRLKELSELVSKPELDKLLLRLGLRDICEIPAVENGIDSHAATVNGSKTPDLGIDVSLPNNDDQLLIETSPKHFAPMVPPRNIQSQINNTLEAFKPSGGTKTDGLLLNSDSDSDFDPRAPDNDNSSLGGNKISNDLFGFEPPKPSMGQQLFTGPGLTNNHNSFTNMNNGSSNGFGAPTSPPPILAPPPQKSAPRRNPAAAHQNNGNGYQDLFGSAPFNPQTNDTDASFGDSFDETNFTATEHTTSGISESAFNDEIRFLTDNSSKINSILALNKEVRKAGPLAGAPATAQLSTAMGAMQPDAAAAASASMGAKLNPFASVVGPAKNMLRMNPLAAVKHSASSYGMFQNASSSDGDFRNGSVSPLPVPDSASTSQHHPHLHLHQHQHQHHQQPTQAQPSTMTAAMKTTSSGCGLPAAVGRTDRTEAAAFDDFALSAFNQFKKDLSKPTPICNISSSSGANSQAAAFVTGEQSPKQSSMASEPFAAVVTNGIDLIGTQTSAHGAFAQTINTNRAQASSKNGLFSSDDLLDTFDPLKK